MYVLTTEIHMSYNTPAMHYYKHSNLHTIQTFQDVRLKVLK